MKIRAPVRRAYLDQEPLYKALKGRVDDIFANPCRERRWHYESRVKEETSFALKIETGRVGSLDSLEDFFASTIVVRNSSEIREAVRFINDHCNIASRRPPSQRVTPNRASTFEFDDLRLYVRLKPNPAVPARAEDGKLFEVQIKTFLFHAWSIATHDLMYKSDEVSWGRERIAFQVRAMLEHAETTIQQAAALAKSANLEREDRATEDLRKIIQVIKATWPADQLPNDLRRLSQNIRDLLSMLGIARNRWKNLVEAERARGPLPIDENPYQVSVRLAFEHEPNAVQAFLTATEEKRRLVVYDTFERPAWFDPATANNVLWIGD